MRVSELEVGGWATRYFGDMGWTCYFEVEVPGLSGRPDLVAIRPPLTLIAECKTRMGFALLDQVIQHAYHAHYVLAVTPYNTGQSRMARAVLRREGIGWLVVGAADARVEVEPRLFRTAVTTWVKRLRPEHQTICLPGSAGGGYWTPFKATCRAIQDYLRSHPGASTKTVIDNVQHHYRSAATAKSALPVWAAEGKIPGVIVTKDGRNLSWWLDSQAPDDGEKVVA